MSLTYPGGLITKSPVAPSGPYETSTAPGIWTLDQALQYKKAGLWPTQGNIPTDPDFEYVTMLLPGNGTNGAQNNTFLDSSANAFSITRNGNTTQGTFTPYGDNWSNYFGSSNYIGVADNAGIHLGTGDFTVEFLVFSNNLGSTYHYYEHAQNNYELGFYSTSDGKMHADSYTSGGGTNFAITSSTAMAVGTWYHFALVRNGSGSNNVTLYQNGVSVGTATYTGSMTNGSGGGYNIGAYYTGTGNPIGYISNLRVVKGSAVYTAGFTPPTSPLTAITNTQLLTCQSNRFVDNSANAIALTANGSPSVQRFSPFNPTAAYSAATNGGSGYFDGSGDYLTGPTTNSAFDFGSGDWTIETWAYPTAFSNQMAVIISLDDATGGYYAFGLLINTNGSVQVYQANSTPAYFINTTSSTGVVSLNTWNHIAAVRSGSNFAIFVNGVRVANATGVSGTQAANRTPNIGQDPYASNLRFSGYLSNLRVVKGTAVYNPTQSSITVPTAPLTAITNTSLLLNFTNAGIIDNAMMNNLETVGNAQISTTQSKFGGGSMYFDGTGDYLTVRSGPWLQFAKNFTLECWIYPTSSASNQFIFSAVDYWRNSLGLQLLTNRTIKFVMCDVESSSGVYDEVITSSTVSLNTWSHVAVARYNGTLTVYINGTSGGSTSSVRVNYIPTGLTAIGSDGGSYLNSSLYTGYIDDLRVTNGIARYTANFTPPTTAFFLF